MPNIGETLREARVRQGVDIAEVESATKIRAKYLRALENEEFDLLPGPTFVRSFIKTYAQHLGLDARMLVEEFRTEYEGLPDDEPAPAFSSRTPAQGRRREPARYERRPQVAMGWIVGGVLAALLALFLVLGLTGGDSGGGGSEGTAGTTQTASERQAAERRERRRARERRERRSRPKTVSVRITPEGPTYACVDRGEGETPLFEGSLTSPRTFRGKRVRINLGRPSARVRANGRNVDLGSESEPVGFSFSPGKRPRPLPLGQRPCV